MSRSLRSLSGLLDFECAARWASFKLASKELHKTPAAVSQQIKQLESQLGFALFERQPRQVVLTPKGAALAETVRSSLQELNEKIASLQAGEDENVVRVSVPHSLSMKWLIPRLAQLAFVHPQIDLRIEASDESVQPRTAGCDIALRISSHDPGEGSVLLGHEDMVAVYSPRLETECGPLGHQDLNLTPLIYQDTPELWLQWMRHNHTLQGDHDFRQGFSHSGILVQAAVAGQGIALVPYVIAAQDLQTGLLRQLPGKALPSPCRYYAVAGPAESRSRPVQLLCDWLLDQFSALQSQREDLESSPVA